MKLIDRFRPPETWREGKFTNARGVRIHYGTARPLGTTPKGIIVITTGYAGFGREYYENLNNYLEQGFAVYAMDWQGHGDSDPFHPSNTPYETMYESYVADLHQLVTQIIKPDGTLPLILSTHSMGGHIGIRYLHDHPGIFQAAIKGAPMLDINTHGLPKAAWRYFIRAMICLGHGEDPLPGRDVLGRLFRTAKSVLGIDAGNRTLRKAFAKAISLMDPEYEFTEEEEAPQSPHPRNNPQPSYNWMHHTFPSIDLVNREDYLRAIRLPILFAISEQDDLVDNAAIWRAAQLTGNEKNIVFLENASHSLWFEKDEIIFEWWQHIVNFLNRVVAEFKPRLFQDNAPPAIRKSSSFSVPS